MTTIFNSNKWLSIPTAYWTINYEAKRSGSDTLVRFYWKVWLGASSSYYYDGLQLQLFLDGSQKNVTVKGYNSSEEGWSYEGTTGWYTVSNKTSGTVPFYAKLYDTNSRTIKVTSSTYHLTVAPNVIQKVVSKTETSITMQWQSDSAIDYLWYSINGGTDWKAVGSVASVKSGTYTISGLTANEQYTIVTRARRKEGQLTGDSGAEFIWTYDYPHCTSTPNFTIGDAVTLKFYNPLNRTFKFYIYAEGTKISKAFTCSSTSFKGLNDDTTVAELYNTIKQSQSGEYMVDVVYGSSTKRRDNGNTFSIKGTEVPLPGTLSYRDSNSFVSGITGDDQLIVQYQSYLYVEYGKAKGQNGAEIQGYTFEAEGISASIGSPEGGAVPLYTIKNSNNFMLTMTVTDSRGLKSSKQIEVKVARYSEPTASISLKRTNNYEDETTLNVDADISSVNGKNSVTIKYQYKEQDEAYNTKREISNRTDEVLSVSKDKNYIFKISVEDKFGSLFVKEIPLGKGVFPLFIDTEKNAVSVNDFPGEGEAFRVKGGVANLIDGLQLNGVSIVDVFYPVGSVYISSTYTSPREILGGTWELIGKEFKSAYWKTDEPFDINPNFDSPNGALEFRWCRNGHTIYTRFRFKSNTEKLNFDDGTQVCALNLWDLGVQDLCYTKYSVGYSRTGDAVFQAELTNDGKLNIYNVVGRSDNQMPLNSICNVEFTHTINDFFANADGSIKEMKIDEHCDKFYWKRTA